MLAQHSAAQILAQYLIDEGVFSEPPPADENAWPLYVGHLPGGKDVQQAGVVIDEEAERDGRVMPTGEIVEHYGFTLRTRSRTRNTALRKATEAADLLSSTQRSVVNMEDGEVYRIHAVTTRGAVHPRGIESETRLWLASGDFISTVDEVTRAAMEAVQRGAYMVIYVEIEGAAQRGVYAIEVFPVWPTVPPGGDMIEELSSWEPDGSPTATRSNMGADLTGTRKWGAGVLGVDGKIYGMPQNSTDILIIDPVAGTATRSAMGAILTEAAKWAGGALGVDGKIYGTPYNAADILIIDTVAGTATRSAMGGSWSGYTNWYGGVGGPDGKIYNMPFNAADILIIDPVAATATRSTMGASMSGSAKWTGGVLGPDGKIYGIPFWSTNILIIDPVAGTASRSAMGADLSDTRKWGGGVLGPDGKIYGVPWFATDILIIDPVAGTATRSTLGADLTGTAKWAGGALGPDGKIYMMPYNATDILIIDTDAGTATRDDLGLSLTDPDKWWGGVLGPDGQIYGVPRDSTTILQISNAGTGDESGAWDDVILTPYLDKY